MASINGISIVPRRIEHGRRLIEFRTDVTLLVNEAMTAAKGN